MRFNRIVLAISLLAASSLASAAGPETYTPSAQMGDTFIMQTSVSSAVQISVSAEAGSALASLTGPSLAGSSLPGPNSVAPTAELDYTSYLGLPIVKPVTTVSPVSPDTLVVGKGSASVLVTQDVNAILAVPTSAITAVLPLLGNF
jgi:hypothetical protein